MSPLGIGVELVLDEMLEVGGTPLEEGCSGSNTVGVKGCFDDVFFGVGVILIFGLDGLEECPVIDIKIIGGGILPIVVSRRSLIDASR